MFVVLSKIADWLLSPLSWALLLLGAAFVLNRRSARISRSLIGSAFVILFFFSLPPISNLLYRWVESGAQTTLPEGERYDAVILLGGSYDAAAAAQTGALEVNEAADRLLRTYDLLRTGRAASVLISGGALEPVEGRAPEAEVYARTLQSWGIAPERIFIESGSRNTAENARYSAPIVREQGWQRIVLITSAAHMARALGAFRAAGISATPLAVDVRSHLDFHARDLLPRAGSLGASADALRELFGRLVYRVMGYSAAN